MDSYHYAFTDDDSSVVPSEENTVNIRNMSQRPSLMSPAGRWKLKQEERSLLVCQWDSYEDDNSSGSALSFIHGVTERMCTNLTRLRLQLDTRLHAHDHYQADSGGLPNRATEAEVVNVCRALGHTLVGLSISMCKPELIVPHLPRFVHEIGSCCPLLQSFGLEDMRCSDFDDDHMENYVNTLASIARRDQSEEWIATNTSCLRTLVISKRAGAPWRDIYEATDPDPLVAQAETTIYYLQQVQRINITDPKLARIMIEETREISAFTIQRFPSLRRVYVMLSTLDKGAVDSCMGNIVGGHDPVRADNAHLAPLEEDPQVAFTPAMVYYPFVSSATPPQVLDALSPASASEASVDSNCSSESGQTVTEAFSPDDTFFQSPSLEGCLRMDMS